MDRSRNNEERLEVMSVSSSVMSASSVISPIIETLSPVLDNMQTGKKDRFGRRARAVMTRRDAELDNDDGGFEMDDGSLIMADDHGADGYDNNNCGGGGGSTSESIELSIQENPNRRGGGGRRGSNRRGRKRRGLCSLINTSYDKLLSIAEWDCETKRLYKLGTYRLLVHACIRAVARRARCCII